MPKEEKTVQQQIDEAVAIAVKAALEVGRHQHTPLEQVTPELSGRSREEGRLVVSKTGETQEYTEWTFNDGTVRRDFK